MFQRQYPKTRCYTLRENNRMVTYLLEYSYLWECDPNTQYTPLDTHVTTGTPGPYFHKTQFQNVIKFDDISDTKNGREAIDKLHRQDALWHKKIKDQAPSNPVFEAQIIADCKPARLRQTGVADLLHDIKNATKVIIYGFAGDEFLDSYNHVQISHIDSVTIELGAGKVSRNGKDVLTIPKSQVAAVVNFLDQWRMAAIVGHFVR